MTLYYQKTMLSYLYVLQFFVLEQGDFAWEFVLENFINKVIKRIISVKSSI